MRTTNIITLNVQGLRGQASRDIFFAWLLCLNIDFLCVQETHANSIQEFSSWVEDYNNRARRTRNCVAKVHRVARAPWVLLFSFAPSFRLNMFEGMTVDASLLSNFLATILTSKSCAYMRRILGMKGVNFFSPFISLLIQTSQL